MEQDRILRQEHIEYVLNVWHNVSWFTKCLSLRTEETVMMKLVLVLFLATVSSSAWTQAATDPSPWEKIGENHWKLPFSRQDSSAVIELEVKESTMYFVLRAKCKQPGKSASLSWKTGDVLARGKDCRGNTQTYETEKLDGWINPLPREVYEQGYSATSEKKKGSEKTTPAQRPIQVV